MDYISQRTDSLKKSMAQKLKTSKTTDVVRKTIKDSTNPASPVSSESSTIVKYNEIGVAESGYWSSIVKKSQDDSKYKKIYENLNEQSKAKFSALSEEDKNIILKIFENSIGISFNFSIVMDSSDDDYIEYSNDSEYNIQNSNNTILSNLIEIFQNNENKYSDLKDYYTQNTNNKYSIDILENCQVSDLKNYLSKTNLTPDAFFKTDRNFKEIMLAMKQNQFESEEIKDQVKENLFELAAYENLNSKGLSEDDIKSIIKFLTNKNEKIENDSVGSKMEILKQLTLFNELDIFSRYNVEAKLAIFNTFVDLIPQNEAFEDYKDKIIGCVNTCAENGTKASLFLQDILNPNINNIKEKGYKKILDKMTKIPYKEGYSESYCKLIFDDKYANTSDSILRLIYENSGYNDNFDTLYDKYLPMLQNADDDTISKMKPRNMQKLYNLYEFFNEIQVNDEKISLKSLPFQKLKKLQLLLIKNNFSSSFENIDISFINDKFDKVFIKNDGIIDYDSTLFEVNKLLATKHLDLSQTQKDSINNILGIKDNLANIDFEKIKIDKTDDFKVLQSKVKDILEKDNSISDNDKAIILARLTNDIDSIMFNKLPSDLEDLDVMKPIRDEIKKYLSFKKVEGEKDTYIIGNSKISGIDTNAKSALKSIFEAIPELVALLGINQKGHNFDIGKHILAVGKEVVKNEKFRNLDENNQKLVLIAALMHDIAKVDGGQDPTHPQRGSQYAYNMLSGALEEDKKVTVANLIFNHHFGEYIGKGEDNNEQMYTLAYECKDQNPEFLNMLEILGEADLLGDDKDYASSKEEYIDQIPQRIEFLKAKIKTIDDVITKLKDTLEITPFPQETIRSIGELPSNEENNNDIMQKCKEFGIIENVELDGIKISKIDLAKMKYVLCDKQKQYLECLGFKNVDYNQIELLIHSIDGGRHVNGIDYLTSQFKSDATLSTSIITMANTKTFHNRQYGFIMEPDKTKVLSAATSNINSGYGKGRNQSGKFIIKTQNMQDYDEYLELSNYLNASKRSPQAKHSELITIDNEVAAIFVKEGYENTMPKELVEFAYKRNLPLIVVPDLKVDDEEQM